MSKVYLTDQMTPNEIIEQVRGKDRDIIRAMTLMLIDSGEYTFKRIKQELEKKGITVAETTVSRWVK